MTRTVSTLTSTIAVPPLPSPWAPRPRWQPTTRRSRRVRRSTPRRNVRCATRSPARAARPTPSTGSATKLSAEDIKAWIVTPVEMTAKTKSTKKPPMPTKYGTLPAADLDALVAYLQSLK